MLEILWWVDNDHQHGLVALPAGMLASGFNRQMHRRHQKFNVLLKEMVRDGVVIEQEWDDFEVMRKELDLDEEEAELRIHRETRTRQVLACPHSGGELHQGRPKEGA